MKNMTTLTALAAAAALTAGSASAQIELTTNGGFETGDTTGWTSFVSPPSTFTVINDGSAFEGSFFGRIDNNQAPSGQVVKQANIGVGQVSPGQEVTISFMARGVMEVGGVPFAEFFSEIDPSGTSSTEILGGGPLFFNTEGDWLPFSFTAIAGPDVSGGVTLQLNAATGGASGSEAILDIDDVSVTVIPEPSSLALIALGGLATLRRRRRA